MDSVQIFELLADIASCCVEANDRGAEANDRGAVILSYENSCLREADVKLLEPQGWINDEIVGFVFEYFEKDQFKEISEEICFISPQVSQLIKLCQGRSDDEISELLQPLNLSNKKYIIVPVNDSSSCDSTAGTHWSIMAYSKDAKRVFYLDSYGGYNRRHANILWGRIGIHFQAFKDAPLTPVSCPQQPNVCDCGLYALCFVEEICKGLLEKRKDFYNVDFDAEHAVRTRKRIKETIYRLAQN